MIKEARQPNILLIIVDCLRADHCPVTGPTELRAWQRLRDNGVCFSQLISTASTTPVCFAGLLTGLYAFANGIDTMWGLSLSDSVETLAGHFQQAGYRTSAYMTGPMLEVFGLNRNFDVYKHRTRQQTVYTAEGQSFVENFIACHQENQPWFTVLHLFEVHRPRQTAAPVEVKNSYSKYKTAWRDLDAVLDSIIEKMPDNTVVALSGDHGEAIGRRADATRLGHMARKLRERFKRDKHPDDYKSHGFYVYEELIRIPFVLSGAEVPRGVVSNAVVRQIDIVPTLMDAAGLALPQGIHGRSLRGYWQGQPMPDTPAYVQSGWSDCPFRSWHALRDGQWKYVEHPRSGPCLECQGRLYDLANDPQEKRNVIHDHPERAIEMRQQIDALIYGQLHQPTVRNPMSQEDKEQLETHLSALGYL